jgi:UPF0755 protein
MLAIVATLFLFSGFYILLFRAPSEFPIGKVIVISKGMSVREVAAQLYEKEVVSSPTMFSVLSSIFGRDKIIAGGYLFEKRLSVFSIASRVTRGDFNVGLTKVTFPEGSSILSMAKECEEQLPGCKGSEFLSLAMRKEGYLFPDTYFFQPGVSAADVVAQLEQTFEEKIIEKNAAIKKFGKPLEDVITMASLLEAEAAKMEDRRIIAGILWNRLKIDMPLQVDAVFAYFTDKNTYELTLTDLRTDSPYNTYTNKGLPPTPINNPGLESIEAAVTPVKTNYVYYLSDKKGNFHFAVTFEQHVANKNKYLR